MAPGSGLNKAPYNLLFFAPSRGRGVREAPGAEPEPTIDLVISEALDRLSRNQADLAQLYQTLTFAGAGIVTLGSTRCISA